MNISTANNNPVMMQMVGSMMQGMMGLASGNPMQALSSISQMMNAFQQLTGGQQLGQTNNFINPGQASPMQTGQFPMLPQMGGGIPVGGSQTTPTFGGTAPLHGTMGTNVAGMAGMAGMGNSAMTGAIGGLFNNMEGIQNQMQSIMANPNISDMQKQSMMTQLNQKMSSMQNMLQMLQQMMSRMNKAMSEIIQAGSNVQNSIVGKLSR